MTNLTVRVISRAEHAAWVGEKLAQHGVRFERLAQARPGAAAQVFRATAVKRDAATTEGRQRVSLTGEWRDETRDLPAFVVLMTGVGQPLTNAAWGAGFLPTSHQGAARPEVKNSAVLSPARRARKSAGTKAAAIDSRFIAAALAGMSSER